MSDGLRTEGPMFVRTKKLTSKVVGFAGDVEHLGGVVGGGEAGDLSHK